MPGIIFKVLAFSTGYASLAPTEAHCKRIGKTSYALFGQGDKRPMNKLTPRSFLLWPEPLESLVSPSPPRIAAAGQILDHLLNIYNLNIESTGTSQC